MNLQLLSLIGYSVLLISLGLWIGRRVDSSASFFVAGRSLGPVLIFSTILAANIGAGSTVGAAGLGYRDGLSAWWWVGSAGLGTLILGLWLGPKIRHLAALHDMHTVGDYLEHRYGPEVRATVAVLLWLGTLAILAGQFIAMAWILEVVAGVPKIWGCLIGGTVVAVYFAAGGLLTSAWVNLVQLVVLIIGFALALIWVMPEGGLGAVLAAAPRESPSYLSFWKGGASGLRYIALLVPAFMISPGLIQKVFGARDDRAVRLGVGASGIALMAFAIVPPLMGMIARYYDPALANPELALPTLLTVALPPFVGGIALAAVLSAELSSADAILFMLSTSLSKDLYGRFLNPSASDALILKVSRLAALGGGALGV
ncbi:MAG: sodium:solute symporter family protein, partial [Thermoanaerobaculia bacterium]